MTNSLALGTTVVSRVRARMAERRALWLATAYLTITLPLLALGAGPPAPDVITLHVVLLVCTVILGLRGGPFRRGERFEPLFPLVLMPALYAELPWVIAAGGQPFEDTWVIGWERALFGGEPARSLAVAYPNALLSNILHLSYLSYYLLIFVPPLVLFIRERNRELRHTVFALTAAFALVYLIFVAFPVEGPRYLWPPAPAPPDQPVRALALRILDVGSSQGTAFPSSHVGIATVQTLFALRQQRALGYVCLVVTIGIAVGAVYGGFHYAVDVLAGAVYGSVVAGLAWRLRRAA